MSARPVNIDGAYAALRGSLPQGDGVQVKDLKLHREGAEFRLDQGNVYFYGPVNGRVTGAVFTGTGHFEVTPVDANERRTLARLAKSETMAQNFTTLVLRFTNGTADEIRKASVGVAAPLAGHVSGAATDLSHKFREKLHENLELRLLEDVMRPPAEQDRGQFFLASFRMGGAFTGRNVLFVVDPDGTAHAAPDQVELSTWTDDGLDVWAAYRMEHSSAENATEPIRISAEKLDISFDRSGKMSNSAETTFTVQRDGMRVVRMNLFPTLRVGGVFDEKGLALDFVQEDKTADPDFALILARPAQRGQVVRVLTRYAGPDAVRRESDNNYYLLPSAREDWYPSAGQGLGNFMDFRMTFHLPKGLQIVSTGKEVSHDAEANGGTRVVWATDAPISVAGFNLGAFKSKAEKTPDGFDVSAYANTDVSGPYSTVPGIGNEIAQGSAAIQVYTSYYGKLPYDHVALTEQNACFFGQSWPMLVYIPACAFWDSTIQNQFGLLSFGGVNFYNEVTPHEMAHQWWGQLVGFGSYRDQWMSEGFAQFSVGLYKMHTSKDMKDYRDFWAEQRTDLLRKNEHGLRPVDVGPLTMGYRVNNTKTGDWVAQQLVYAKGAYILHMLEMMYWTPKLGQEPFKHSLQAFIQQYSGKAASTEDFKASFEKTMPKWLDLQGNGKLDWFFDEYVYGTELPHYEVASDFTTSPEGEITGHFKVIQSGVSKDFVMLVPLYLQMANGNTVRIANLTMHGNDTTDRTLKLGKLPSPGKKFILNYNADVLSD